MQIDSLGLPKDTGASDKQDSSRAAGIMSTFKHGELVPLEKYVVDLFGFPGTQRVKNGVKIKTYVRHPQEYVYNFSRDQSLCLMAGLYFHKQYDLVNRDYVNGADWFSPSNWGHVRRCSRTTTNWFFTWVQDSWLWLDTWYAAKHNQLGEPNQLLSMLMVADQKYLRYWIHTNTQWQKAITDYWCGWRNENALAASIIKVLQTYQS